MRRDVLPIAAVAALALANLSSPPCSALEFADVSGTWVLDVDYVHELWKADRGAQYDPAEWKRISNDPHQFDPTDEVRLDSRTLAFFSRAKKNVDYPVLKVVPEKEVVWVDFRHFAYGTMRFGFVRNGANLKIVFSDGVWKLFAGYRRPQ